MIRWCNLSFGTRHLIQFIRYFVLELFALIGNLCSKTSIFTDKLIQQLSNCWYWFVTSWFGFRWLLKKWSIQITTCLNSSTFGKKQRSMLICFITSEETRMFFSSCLTLYCIARCLCPLVQVLMYSVTSLTIVYQ